MAKTWTIDIGALVGHNYRRLKFQGKLETNKPAKFEGTVEYNAGIDYWDLVEIKRDGTVEFKGFVEVIDVKWDENGRYLYIGGRDTKVIPWKKYSDNFSNMHEDTKGFFGRVKAEDLITFLLRTPKSDFDPDAFPNNKEGWGIDVSKFGDFVATKTSIGDPNYTKLRRRGYGWRNSGDAFASETDVVDDIICGDGVEPACDGQPAWTPNGASPYLGVEDDANYIETNTDDATAIFSFDDLPATVTNVELVHLTVVWKPDATWWSWINTECDVYIYDGTTWHYVGVFKGKGAILAPNPWRHITWNISHLIDTVSKFNSCQIKFVNKSTALTTNITQAYLSVGYITGGTQSIDEVFDMPFASEEIVGIYVESRMDDESYPRKYKIVTVTSASSQGIDEDLFPTMFLGVNHDWNFEGTPPYIDDWKNCSAHGTQELCEAGGCTWSGGACMEGCMWMANRVANNGKYDEYWRMGDLALDYDRVVLDANHPKIKIYGCVSNGAASARIRVWLRVNGTWNDAGTVDVVAVYPVIAWYELDVSAIIDNVDEISNCEIKIEYDACLGAEVGTCTLYIVKLYVKGTGYTEVEDELVPEVTNIYRDIIHSWTPQTMDNIRIKLTGDDADHSWAISQVYVYKAESCDYRVYKETGCIPTYAADQYISALSFDSAYAIALGPLNLPRARLIDVLNTVVRQCHSAYVPFEWWLALDASNTFHFKNQKGGSPTVSFVKGVNLGKATRTKDVSDTVQRVRVIGRGEGKRQEDISSDWINDTTAMGNVNSFYEDILSKKSMVDKIMSELVAEIHLSEEAEPKDQLTITVNDDSYASMAYDTGDIVTVIDSLTGTSGTHRIYNITKEITGDGEVIVIVVDSPERDDADEWAELYKRLKELELAGVIAADWTGEADNENKVTTEVITDFFEKTAKNEEDFSKKDIKDPSWYVSPAPTAYVAPKDAKTAGGNRGTPAYYTHGNGRRWTHQNDWMKLTGPNSGNAVQTLLVELRGDSGEEISIYMRQNPKLVFEMKIFEDEGIPEQWWNGDYFDVGLANALTDKGYFFRVKALGSSLFEIYACWNETGTPADTQEQFIKVITRNVKYRLEIITEDSNRLVIFNVYNMDQEQKYPPSAVKLDMDRDIVVRPLYMYLSANDNNADINVRARVYVYKFKTEWEKVQ